MAKKKVGAMSTGEVVGIAAGAGILLYLFMNNKPVTPPLVIHTTPPANPGITPGEIAAGAGLLTSLLGEFSNNS